MEQTGIEALAEQYGCRVSRDAPMSAATTFHIGGTADCLIDLPDEAAAQAVLAACHRAGVTPFFLGNGSDLLVGDRGIRGVVLRWDGKRQEPRQLPDGTVVCPAGVSLQQLCRFAQQRGLTGLEFAYGIPGSVGGALFMNAGAYGGEMAQVVLGATALTPTGERRDYTSAALRLAYRHSVFAEQPTAQRELIAAVQFRLTAGDPEEIAARMKDLMVRRREKQPLEYPSAGSFFKRPEGYFAAALLEECGLKGYRIGDAQISDKHAGFVVNRGHATAAEILALCHHAQETVRRQRGVALEPEVQFVGEF